MRITSATSAAPLTTSSFAARIDAPMPRGLRQEADAMSFDAFHHEYASSPGPLRLGTGSAPTPSARPRRLGPQARNYQATLAVGDRISTRRPPRADPSRH